MFKTKIEIQNWLNEMGVKKYTINEDLTVDVDGDVDFKDKKLYKLPVQFGIVNGEFYLWNNNLSSLKGCPTTVKGNFDCCNNYLKNLQYCPKEVSGIFLFHGNAIESLEYLPEYVGTFSFYNSDIKSLKGFTTQIGRSFMHECTKLEECINEVQNMYQHNPDSYYRYRLVLSGKELNAIRQNDALREELPIKDNLSNKKPKL